MNRLLSSERNLAVMLAILNLFDIFIHIFIQKVEPLRVSGNLVAILCSIFLIYVIKTYKLKLITIFFTGLLVLLLNLIWIYIEGSLPLGASILIGSALIILIRLFTVIRNHQ